MNQVTQSEKKQNVKLFYFVVIIGINTLTIIFLLLNLINIWFGVILFVAGNLLPLLGTLSHISWINMSTCSLCDEEARFYYTNFLWDGSRTRKDWEGMNYCLDHQAEFFEAYKGKVVDSAAKFIFFKEDPHFGDYIHLSLEHLRVGPIEYSDDDLEIISQLLDSAATCEKCGNKAVVVLVPIGVIQDTLEPPLFKDKSHFERNELLCVDCFIEFLKQEIKIHGGKWPTPPGHLRITIPSAEKGIYLFEQ